MLQQSRGIEEPGGVNMGLFGCLAVAWVIVAVALIRGVASMGKACYALLCSALHPLLFTFSVPLVPRVRCILSLSEWKDR